MLKRLLLAGVLAILCVLPGVADVSQDLSCNNEDLHVFSGTVEIEANWTANTYQCPISEYFYAETAECLACPGDGAFCPGTESFTYDGTNHGLGACGEGWTSDSDAVAESDCYKIDTVACSAYNPYTLGHGVAVYLNESVQCKQNKGSEDCVAATPETCAIDHLNCAAGYEQKTNEDSLLECVAKTKDCGAGTYLPLGETECQVCPENSFCPGLTYTLATYTELDGIESCAAGLKSPLGARSENDCGRILHVGTGEKDIIHMHRDKVAGKHYLVVDVDGVKYYADATPVESVPVDEPITINPNTDKTLHVNMDGVEYFIHERIYE